MPVDTQPERIDVGAQQVAAVYGRALLGAAQNAGVTDQVVEEYRDVVEQVLRPNPKFAAVLKSGFVDHVEKVGLLDRVFKGRVSSTLLNFFKVLSQHDRLDLISAAYEQLLAAYDELRGRVKVEVRTVAPLDAAAADLIKSQITKLIGGQPRLEWREDPDLIGGVVLRVGDTVYDGSIATQLREAKAQMIHRSVHEIQSRRDRFSPAG
jgi:F-type H+-transporting ATPase subunit delta